MLSMLIIPAASAVPLAYEQIVQGVAAHGFDIEVLHIPSVGLLTGPRPGNPPTMYEDAAFIAKHIARLADAGKDVLLITHSYGGTPATESVKGLSKQERVKQGKEGGVVGLAYMTSLVPELGYPASTSTLSPLMEVGDDGWLYYPDPALLRQIPFSDLSDEKAAYYATKLVNHSAIAFTGLLTYAGYKDVPVSYLVAEEDRSIQPATQRAQIAMIEKASGRMVDVTTLKAGHVPNISHAEEVIN